MTILPIVDHTPGAMTKRARVYMHAAGHRHFWIGFCLLVTPWLFQSGAFIPIFNLLPLIVWGVIMTLTGLTLLVSSICRNKDLARLGMILSATITLVLGVGLSIGIVAVWSRWVDVVGWGVVGDLMLSRPAKFPVELLDLAPPPPSPFLPIIMLALAVKDFAVCAQPLRVPLEDTGARKLRPA